MQVSTPHDAREALAHIHKIRVEYGRIETGKKLEEIQAYEIAKYQNWKYSLGDQGDFFEIMVNPKRRRGTTFKKYWTPNIRLDMIGTSLQR